MDPLGAALIGSAASAAGKLAAEKAVKRIVKRADSIEQIFQNDFKIEGQEMIVLCPEGIQKYSIVLIPKKSPIFPKKIKFKDGVPRRVELKQIRGLSHFPVDITDVGFNINMKSLSPGELYVLDIEYPIENVRFLDALVDRTIPRDVPHILEEDTREYEMSARIKHLGVLKQKYYKIDLREVDFTVDVAVHQDIKTTIPGIFKRRLENLVELSKRKGRSEMFNIAMKQYQLQKGKYGGRDLSILKDLYELFTPSEFSQFVKVRRDFAYSDCMRGSDFYDTLPFPTWPKSMKVVSRTDLNSDKPAADGVLIYKHKDFISEIEKYFGIAEKKKKKRYRVKSIRLKNNHVQLKKRGRKKKRSKRF